MQFCAAVSFDLKISSCRPLYGSNYTVPYESYLEQGGFMSHGLYEYAGSFCQLASILEFYLTTVK